MYKVASDRRQSALHRGRASDWVNGQEALTNEQKLRQAKDGWAIIEARIKECADPDQRKALIEEKRSIEATLSELKKALKIEHSARDGYCEVFTQMAREILPKSQFALIRATAIREWNLRQEAARSRPLNEAQCADPQTRGGVSI